MKKIIITSLLLLTMQAFANTATTECVNNGGENQVVFNDTSIQSGQPATLRADNNLRLHDLVYPMVGLFTQIPIQCIDGACQKFNPGPAVSVLPQGWIGTLHFDVNLPPLAAGAHMVTYEIYLPEYDCRAMASATIIAI